MLLVSNGFQPSYEKGFANGLSMSGIEVSLVGSDRTLVSDLHPLINLLNLRGSQNPRRKLTNKIKTLALYAFRLFFQLGKKDYQVVHLIGLFLTSSVLIGLFECLIMRVRSRRFIMTVHNLLPHNNRGFIQRLLFRLIYRIPVALVVHTEQMRDGLVRQFSVSERRIVVMPHGVDLPSRSTVNPLPSDRLRILMFGGINRYKGVDVLFESLRYCDDINFDIFLVGECRDAEFEHELESLIARLPVQHKVFWTKGFVPEKDLYDYFSSVDVVALPYRSIDQSGVLFTSLGFGVPVIATNVGSFRSSVPDYAGIVEGKSDPIEFSGVIKKFFVRRVAFDHERIRAYAETLKWESCVQPCVNAYAL